MQKKIPGTSGLPLLGETPAFVKDSFAFFSERHRQHGPVFKTHVLFKPTFCVVGPEAAELFADPANIAREGSLPPHISGLFGAGAVNQIDGEGHRTRKGHILAAMTPEALAHYLPAIRRTVRAAVARWNKAGELLLQPELKRLTAAIAADNLLGVQDEARTEQITTMIESVGAAFGGLPLNLPGTALRRALTQRDALMVWFSELASERRAHPTGDGLSRMLASEINGQRLDARWAVIELHHMMLAGFIVWAAFASGILRLHQDPALAQQLRAVAQALPDEPTARAYAEAPGLHAFTEELKRTTPIVPAVFGIALRPLEVNGLSIPAGSQVILGLYSGHNDPRSPFTQPERFDPDRFSDARAEHRSHPEAFHPQGSGHIARGHKCAGVDYSTLLLEVFFAELLRGAPFTVPPQDLTRRMGLIPPEFKGEFKVRFG